MRTGIACLLLNALAGVFSSCSAVVSCTNSPQAQTQSLTVMNWNLETFFDARFDGTEYTQFKNAKSGWSREKYDVRLDRLAEVIKALDADVLVFEELEKEEQLYDISNRLSGTFNFAKMYGYSCFAIEEGSSIGCAVLSRFPLGEVSVHALDIRTESETQPSMRPLLQVSVQNGEKKLVLFVNHWKSKSGDKNGETALWRRYQERVLADCMASALAQGNAVLACGDFNMDIVEFTDVEDGSTRRENVVLRGKTDVAVYSPWYDALHRLTEPGSYYYQNAWERIDHFFAAGAVTLSAFAPQTKGAWATSAGVPVCYQLYSGKGYSDHLPIMCTVTF